MTTHTVRCALCPTTHPAPLILAHLHNTHGCDTRLQTRGGVVIVDDDTTEGAA